MEQEDNKFPWGPAVIVVLLLIFAVYGFVKGTQNYQRQPVMQEIVHTVTEIDGCQYVAIRNVGGWAITHKGNCSNPIHKVRVEN